jgi:hypothetical protein
MTITHWDEKAFHMKHEFFVKGRVVAAGTSKGVIRGKYGVISPEDVIGAMNAHRKKHPKKFKDK